MPSVTRQSNEQSDHNDIPNPIPEQRHDTFEQRHDAFEQRHDAFEQRHDTFEDEVAVDDQQQTDNSDDARDSEVINNIRYFSLWLLLFFYCYSKVLFFSFVLVEDKAV